MEHEGDSNINCCWCTWKSPKRPRKYPRNWKSEEELRRSIPQHCKISSNTEKSPRNPRRLAIIIIIIIIINLGQKTWPYDNPQKERTCIIVDLAVPADHRIKLWVVLLVQSPKDYLKDWRIWRLEDEWRPSKLQHYWEQPEYWEESCRLEETFCYSNIRSQIFIEV